MDWPVAWRHQAIAWPSVELSSKIFLGIYLKQISPDVLMNENRNMLLLASLLHFPETNKFKEINLYIVHYLSRNCWEDAFLYVAMVRGTQLWGDNYIKFGGFTDSVYGCH